MWSSCPTAAPAAPSARAWPTRFYRLLRSRQAAGRPPFRRIALETSGLADPGPIALHALRRRLSRSLAAPRPRRDDDRCRRRPGDARSLSRGDRAGRRGRSAAADQDRSGAASPTTCCARLASLNPLAPIVDGARCRRGAPAVRRLAQGAAAAAARTRRRCMPTASTRSVGPIAAADEPAGVRHGAGRPGARSRREAAAREGPGRILRPAAAGRRRSMPCSTRSIRRAGWSAGPMPTGPAGLSSSCAISSRTRSCAASPRANRRALLLRQE